MPHSPENRLAYYQAYYSRNAAKYRYRSMRRRDRSRGILDILSFEEYEALCQQPCHYCQTECADGVDAFDNDLGHVASNCLPCCEKCNHVLGDIPPAAKQALLPGLREIGKQDLMTEWILPIKRRNTNDV